MKVFVAPLSRSGPNSFVDAHTLAGSQRTFLSWQQKCQRNSQQKSLRETAGTSAQNDEVPQPLKKH